MMTVQVDILKMEGGSPQRVGVLSFKELPLTSEEGYSNSCPDDVSFEDAKRISIDIKVHKVVGEINDQLEWQK